MKYRLTAADIDLTALSIECVRVTLGLLDMSVFYTKEVLDNIRAKKAQPKYNLLIAPPLI